MEAIERLKEALRAGDRDACAGLAQDLVAQGADMPAVIAELAAELEEVGRRFERMEIFLPEVLFTAEAMTGRDKGLRNRVKVIVGGAPTGKEWADKIGADGWAADSSGAVDVVKEPTDRG